MMENIIYTAVANDYDSAPIQPVTMKDGVRTEVRRMRFEKPSEAVLWNREQKLIGNPRTGLWSLYIDGSFGLKREAYRPLVEGWLAKHDLAAFKHPWRDCAYDEIDECARLKKITPEQAERARSHLMLEGFPRHYGLWALGIIARRSHLNATQDYVMPAVFKLVQEMPRDQVWFPYVMWKIKGSRERIHTVDANIYTNPWFTFRRHGS